jgi:hypothetical protein
MPAAVQLRDSKYGPTTSSSIGCPMTAALSSAVTTAALTRRGRPAID